MWQFRYTYISIVHSDFKPILTEVAGTVDVLVCTVRDDYVADVILLSLAEFADLVAYSTGFSVLHFAVEDFRTALVIGDFDVFSLAVEALSRALLVYAVVN